MVELGWLFAIWRNCCILHKWVFFIFTFIYSNLFQYFVDQFRQWFLTYRCQCLMGYDARFKHSMYTASHNHNVLHLLSIQCTRFILEYQQLAVMLYHLNIPNDCSWSCIVLASLALMHWISQPLITLNTMTKHMDQWISERRSKGTKVFGLIPLADMCNSFWRTSHSMLPLSSSIDG